MKNPMLDFVDMDALRKAAEKEDYVLPVSFDQDLEKALRAFMTRFHPRIVERGQRTFTALNQMSRAKRSLFVGPVLWRVTLSSWFYTWSKDAVRAWHKDFFNPKKGVNTDPSISQVADIQLVVNAVKKPAIPVSIEMIRERIPRTLRRQKGFYAYVTFKIGRKYVTLASTKKPDPKATVSIPTRVLYDNLIAFEKGDILKVSYIKRARATFILLRKTNLMIFLKSS